VLRDLKEHVAYLEERIKRIKQAIQEHIQAYPELKTQQDLLLSIPGIAELTAAKLLSEIRDVRAFEDARQLAAYAGVTLVISYQVLLFIKRHACRKWGT